mgnify:FL=1
MKDYRNNTLLLGIGNDILGDDAVGLLAVRELKQEFEQYVSVVEAMMGGLKLVEVLEGYERVLILDAIMTGKNPPGTILEITKEEFNKTVAIAPHFVSLPEAIEFAKKIGMKFPEVIRILTMEIADPYLLTEEITPPIKNALPEFIEKARIILKQWTQNGEIK